MILIYDVTSESPEHIATVEDGEQTYGEDDFEVDIMEEEDAMLHRYNGPTVIATKVEDDDLAQVGRQAASAGLTLQAGMSTAIKRQSRAVVARANTKRCESGRRGVSRT